WTFIDWPFFEREHRRLAGEIDAWADREVAPFESQEHDIDGLASDFVRRLGRDGWLRYCVPKSHGGVHDRLHVRSACFTREPLAYFSGLAHFAFAMPGLGSAPIALAGSEALQRHYLPRVAAGSQIGAFAISEPEGGSDVAALRMTARAEGDAYVL